MTEDEMVGWNHRLYGHGFVWTLRGTFGHRMKAVRDRFALQGGTGDGGLPSMGSHRVGHLYMPFSNQSLSK